MRIVYFYDNESFGIFIDSLIIGIIHTCQYLSLQINDKFLPNYLQ